MEYIPVILKGLLITLLISIISLCISVIPGYLVYIGKKSKVKIINFLCTAYIELFEGIPIIVQLFTVYYVLPMVTPLLTFSVYMTAIIVFSLNAIANIASFSTNKKEYLKAKASSNNTKIVILSAILVLRRIIEYTTLLSFLGLTELFRSANKIMTSDGNIYIIFIATGIYLVLSISLKIVYKALKGKFFGIETKQA